MPLIHLVLADYDLDYVNHLSQWFIENKPDQFQISSFTDKVSFKKFVSENKDRINIILAAEEFLTDVTAQNIVSVVLGQAIKLENLSVIEKYKPAPFICENILSVLSNSRSEIDKLYTRRGRSDLVVCFSTNPYLKATMALLLALLSKDYVYLNLDSFPAIILEENTYNKNLSDILYHIKSKKGNPLIFFENAVISSSGTVNFIPPVDNPGDLWELTEDETDELIQLLKSWGHFSKVIVESECNSGPITVKLFEAASCIVLPFDKSNIHHLSRVKSMVNSIHGLNPEKIKWVFCGNSEDVILHAEFDNYQEIGWLSGNMPVFGGFSFDSYKRNQLAGLLAV